MEQNLFILLLSLPIITAILVLIMPQRLRFLREPFVLVAATINLIAIVLLFNKNLSYDFGSLGFGMDFSFRLYHFNAFIVAAAAVFIFLAALYTSAFLYKSNISRLFYTYFLLSISFINAAVLSDNLIILLFFWEGLLLSLFGLIALGNKNSWQTAIKAFIIIGITDLCMLVGIALAGNLAGTMAISKIALSLTNPWTGAAFILLMIGAISKAGSMPFHTWIPDAAIDAPLPFMAIFVGALEKLIGIYFLTRISLDMFKLQPESWASMLMMIVGAITLIFAVMMALVQKDYKRLLSYHAISQVGYMILGIGTCLPVGIVGGLFHMLNNAMYKSCLFLTGGSVEKEAGTTDLEKLGGLRAQMPVTFFCFTIAALSISGVPPFNGFFSKELIYDAALERGAIFYIVALLGSFFTAASFLKLGHAAYLGKINEENKKVKEAPLAMLIPMIVIAIACAWFGLQNSLPIKLIQPVLGAEVSGHHFGGMPANLTLVIISVIVLTLAVINHLWGAKKYGSGLKAVDHIHYAPILAKIYSWAGKGFFDPYKIGLNLTNSFSRFLFVCDRGIDWLSSNLFVNLSYRLTGQIRKVHTGNYVLYLGWSLVGMILVVMYLVVKH